MINEKIRSREVRLIDAEGKQVGVVPIDEARRRADEQGLDLILLSENMDPPICKLVNFGQFKYEQQKKERLAKKNVKGNVVKELKMSPKISDHDFQIRVTHGKKFLEKGFKIKLTIFFKGREFAHPELGRVIIDRYLESVKELGTPETGVSEANRSFVVTINPK